MEQFIENLVKHGKASYGMYEVVQEKMDIYHIHDAKTANPSSVYLIMDKDQALLIDGSNGTEVNQFQTILYALISNRKLSVAITHNHFDHIGLLTANAIPENTQAYVPRDDYNQELAVKLRHYQVCLLDDQSQIKIGQTTLISQYLKGHTQGSMVFIDADKEIVYSGDEVGSGYVWQFFVKDCLTLYEKGLVKLQEATKDFTHLQILPGHQWQASTVNYSGIAGPKTLDQAYLADMKKILDAIYDSKADMKDYTGIASFFDDSVEVSVPTIHAAIDTRISLIDEYIQARKAKENKKDR